jgi:hypothetical protein
MRSLRAGGLLSPAGVAASPHIVQSASVTPAHAVRRWLPLGFVVLAVLLVWSFWRVASLSHDNHPYQQSRASVPEGAGARTQVVPVVKLQACPPPPACPAPLPCDEQCLVTNSNLVKRITELEAQLKATTEKGNQYENSNQGQVTNTICNDVRAPKEWLVFMPVKHLDFPKYMAPYPPGFDRAWIIQDAGNCGV